MGELEGHLPRLLLAAPVLWGEADGHHRRRGGPSGVDYLYEPREAEGDVQLSHPCVVECPKGHLGARLPYGLGRDYPHRLSGLHEALVVVPHDRLYDPFHPLLGEARLGEPAPEL